MIEGIGIDLVEIARIRLAVDKRQRFLNRILTPKEREKFQSIKIEQRALEFLSGRFAAKEALAKALGTGIGKLSFQDIEVLNDAKGAPKMEVKGLEDKEIFISISHSKSHAISQVLISARK